jgi:hypothetical protein
LGRKCFLQSNKIGHLGLIGYFTEKGSDLYFCKQDEIDDTLISETKSGHLKMV